jgi:hypothetical protein
MSNIMASKEAILQRLARLEEEITQLKRDLEQAWGISLEAKTEKLVTLRGKFPELKGLTEAEIDEATRIWEKHAEKTLQEL